MTAPVCVLGGAGRTGRRVVDLLLVAGRDVRIVSRRPRRVPAAPGVTTASADITDDSAVRAALDGGGGVVVSVEPPTDVAGARRVLTDGVAAVASTAATSGIPVVCVSQIYVTRPSAFPGMEAVTAARAAGEDALRASGAHYTIVRPSWLTDEPGGGGVRVEQGDTGDGRVSRDDVAAACVAALADPAAHGLTFELYDDPSAEPPRWSTVFTTLEPDPTPGTTRTS